MSPIASAISRNTGVFLSALSLGTSVDVNGDYPMKIKHYDDGRIEVVTKNYRIVPRIIERRDGR